MIARNTAAGALTVALGPDGAERLVKAALGLTAFEAENAFARAMVDDGVGGSPTTTSPSCRTRRSRSSQKSGVLEVVDVVDQPGRHRRAGEPEDLAAQAERVVDGRGRAPTGCRRRRACWSRACRAAASR